MLLKSICTDLVIPFTVGGVMITSTDTYYVAKKLIKDVDEVMGGCCKAYWEQAVYLYLVTPTT